MNETIDNWIDAFLTKHWQVHKYRYILWNMLGYPTIAYHGLFGTIKFILYTFLLFAVRIVASLGAVCMRTEKNYVCDGADPLKK